MSLKPTSVIAAALQAAVRLATAVSERFGASDPTTQLRPPHRTAAAARMARAAQHRRATRHPRGV